MLYPCLYYRVTFDLRKPLISPSIYASRMQWVQCALLCEFYHLCYIIYVSVFAGQTQEVQPHSNVHVQNFIIFYRFLAVQTSLFDIYTQIKARLIYL